MSHIKIHFMPLKCLCHVTPQKYYCGNVMNIKVGNLSSPQPRCWTLKMFSVPLSASSNVFKSRITTKSLVKF